MIRMLDDSDELDDSDGCMSWMISMVGMSVFLTSDLRPPAFPTSDL